MAALLAAAILGADATVDEKANDIDPNACPEEAPQPTARARVRRSISTLTDDEWDRVTDAMWVMRTTDTPTGQARYGSQYYDWEYFVLRHVVSSVCINEDDAWRDPDLDTTGHDLFAIWHGVQLVEFENALVSVDPQIDGLPYLDYKEIADDLVNYDDVTTTFSRRLGSTLSQSAVAGNLGVPTDGPFAWWPVFDYASIADAFATQPGMAAAYGGDGSEIASEIETRIFNGAFGQLRSCTYEDNADVLTEKVPYLLRAMGDRAFPLTGASYELLEIACRQDTHVDWWGGDDNVNWKSMSTCLEGVLPAEWDAYPGNIAQQVRDEDPHEKVHAFFGGDMMSGPPAPIDPIFWFHHAYFDRIRVSWQVAHPEFRQSGWGVKADYLEIPLGYASDTKWAEGYRGDNYSAWTTVVGTGPDQSTASGHPETSFYMNTFSMAWDREVLLGTKEASLANLSVGAQSLTVRDAMCGPMVPGIYYTYDYGECGAQRCPDDGSAGDDDDDAPDDTPAYTYDDDSATLLSEADDAPEDDDDPGPPPVDDDDRPDDDDPGPPPVDDDDSAASSLSDAAADLPGRTFTQGLIWVLLVGVGLYALLGLWRTRRQSRQQMMLGAGEAALGLGGADDEGYDLACNTAATESAKSAAGGGEDKQQGARAV